MELSRIEFKIVYRAWKIFYIARILYFSAQFTLISQTSFSNCLETWIPIERSKYRNHIEWKILSSKISFAKLSNSYFFQHVLNHFMRNYLWAVLENTLLTNCHTIVYFRYTNVYTFYRARTHTRTHTRARNSGETNRRNDFEHWKRHSRRISNRHEIHATLTGKVTTRTVHVSRTTPVDWASRRAQAPDLSRARDVFLCCGVPFSLSLSLTLSLPLSSLFPSSSNHHAPSIHERVVTSSPLSFF